LGGSRSLLRDLPPLATTELFPEPPQVVDVDPVVKHAPRLIPILAKQVTFGKNSKSIQQGKKCHF
jgi:hypothetical protein